MEFNNEVNNLLVMKVFGYPDL